MKSTSPFKKIKSKTPNALPNKIQNSPPKEKSSPHQQQTCVHTYESKSSNISYFQQSKYKITDKQQYSSRSQNLKDRRQESPNDRLGKINKLLQNITNKHQEMKTKLTQMKQNTSYNQDNVDECTFSPHIRHNPRYIIPSSLSQRTKDWGQTKARHYTSIRQELVSEQIKECTFIPKLIAKPRSTQILREKAMEQQRAREKKLQDIFMVHNENKQKEKQQVSPVKNKITKKYEYKRVDVKNIKSLIKLEMNRINFDF